MRFRRIKRLAAFVGTLFLLFGNGAKGFAQPSPAEANNNHELASLLKRLDASRDGTDLVRDSRGNIVSIALRGTNANDRALILVSTLTSVKELTIQGRGMGDECTREGISNLHKMTNLTHLRLLCVSPQPTLEAGVFKEVCSLKSLESLILVSAYPERSEYPALANLQNLTELRLSYCTNFGDAELCLLTNLSNLRSLYISSDAVSRDGANVLRSIRQLTNVTIRP
jgi:hypothetical protein